MIVDIVEAIVVIAAIKEKTLLIVYQVVEQTISTSATQVTTKKIFASTPTKSTTKVMSAQILCQKTSCY